MHANRSFENDGGKLQVFFLSAIIGPRSYVPRSEGQNRNLTSL